MGSGLGDIQRDLMEALEELWAEVPLVRVAEPGMSKSVRSRLMKAVRRLEERGLLVRVKMWAEDSQCRPNLATFVARPGTTIYSDVLEQDMPVEEYAVQHKRHPATGRRLHQVLQAAKRSYSKQGVHLTDKELVAVVTAEDPNQALKDRMNQLEDRLRRHNE
jgi:hypothetical protein